MHYSSPANTMWQGNISSDLIIPREQEWSQHSENTWSSSPGCLALGQMWGVGPLSPSMACWRSGLWRRPTAPGQEGGGVSLPVPLFPVAMSTEEEGWGRGTVHHGGHSQGQRLLEFPRGC